jgi:hypothetical protein
MGRYVAAEIARIPAADIAESHAKNYPTALVIGRRHFVKRVYDVISEDFPNAILRTSAQLTIDALNGYRRLARDANSRLGWRILLHAIPFSGADDVIAKALNEQSEIGEALPDSYRERHLQIAEIIRRLIDNEGINDDES